MAGKDAGAAAGRFRVAWILAVSFSSMLLHCPHPTFIMDSIHEEHEEFKNKILRSISRLAWVRLLECRIFSAKRPKAEIIPHSSTALLHEWRNMVSLGYDNKACSNQQCR
jgi:hypothetical protein